MRLFAVTIALAGLLTGATWAQETPDYATDAVEKTTEQKVIQGYPDGSIEGRRATTRNELAEIVERLDQLLSEHHRDLAGREDLILIQEALKGLRQDVTRETLRVVELEESVDSLE